MEDLRPETRIRCHSPVVDFRRGMHRIRRALPGARMNQPEHPGQQDIPEFLVFGALRSAERQIWQLRYRTTYRDFASPEVVDEAKPVLVIDGREITVEELWVDEKRAA